MLSKSLFLTALAAESTFAFPLVETLPGVNPTLYKRQQNPQGAGAEANCPYNPNHVPAAPISAKYPYNGAINGKQGKGQGGYPVPAPGDTDHQFIAPDYSVDIRGPCPGLNAMANHNFLARDGITTFNELVDAQQNVYNVGYDLANLLAVLGLTTTDGDIVTRKLSIGCEATSRTSVAPALTGSEPGLAGHNKFEADTSLTRDDYFTAPNFNNFAANSTLFKMMTDSTGGLYNRENLAKYRYERYQQSRVENKNFYFGPFSLLLFGASSFLYELFPSGTRGYTPDVYTISSFFGMTQDGDGWKFNGNEKLPENWTNRKSPYTNELVGAEILAQYLLHPVEFGGNTGNGQFNVLSGPGGFIKNGKLNAPDATSMSCFLYMLAAERLPSSLNGGVTPTVEALSFAASMLSPGFKNLGCPGPLTK